MKSIKLLHFIPLLALIGCSDANNELLTPNEKIEVTNTSASINRSTAEAIEIAQEAAVKLYGVNSRSTRNINTNDIKVIKSPITRGNSDTLLYVLNFEDNQGFALVSAKKTTEGLIALIEEGNFVNENSLNPAALDYFKAAQNYIVASTFSTGDGPDIPKPITPDPITPDPSFGKETDRTDTICDEYVSRMVHVQYGQKWPEGTKCPHGVCGCVPTAAAMIMSYFKIPAQIQLTYDNNRIISIDWDLLNQHRCDNASQYYCPATPEGHDQLAHLCRELGHRAHTDYTPYTVDPETGDTTYMSSTPSKYHYKLFENTGLNISDYRDYVPNQSIHGINENCLMLVCGKPFGSNSGHAWVIDGYRHFYTIHYHYEYMYGASGQIIQDVFSYETNTCVVHINWGYNGKSNGYFSDGVFDGTKYKELDFGVWKIGEFDYSYNVKYNLISR